MGDCVPSPPGVYRQLTLEKINFVYLCNKSHMLIHLISPPIPSLKGVRKGNYTFSKDFKNNSGAAFQQ